MSIKYYWIRFKEWLDHELKFYLIRSVSYKGGYAKETLPRKIAQYIRTKI